MRIILKLISADGLVRRLRPESSGIQPTPRITTYLLNDSSGHVAVELATDLDLKIPVRRYEFKKVICQAKTAIFVYQEARERVA